MIIVGIVGYLGVTSLDAHLTDMYDNQLTPTEELGILEASIWETRGDTYKYILVEADRPATKTAITNHFSTTDGYINKYAMYVQSDDEKKLYGNLKENWTKYQAAITEIMKNADVGNTQAAIDSLSSGDATTSRKDLTASLDKIIEMNLNDAKALHEKGDAAFTAITIQIIFAIIIGVIIALALGLIITRSITGPLGKAVLMLQEMSFGHLSQRLNLNRKDEVGVLAGAMDTFSDDLQNNFIAALKQIAAGDLSITISAKDNKDEISPAMMNMLEELRGLVAEANMLSKAAVEGKLSTRGDAPRFKGGFREVIEGVNATLEAVVIPVNEAMRLSGSYARGDYTDQFNGNMVIEGDFVPFKDALNQIGIQGSGAIGGVKNEVDSLTAGMEETSSSTEEVASTASMLAENSSSVSVLAERSGEGIKQTLTAMEDLSQTVSAVATKAEQSSGMAKQTVDLSEKGLTLAGKAEKGMAGITNATGEIGVIITDISSQMEEIGKIVGVITGIAEQTGLLALNAAIEAARAGEAGMGFAVVADEVKSLALESQKSAENITMIIGNLQKKSVKVSESMKTASTEVKAGNEAVSETLSVFNEIVEAINVVYSNMTEVAGATEEQAAAVEEITASVHELGDLVQETAGKAVDSAAATEEVTASIDQITKAITEAVISVQRISTEMGRFTTS